MKILSMKIVIILCGVLLLCGCFGEDKTRTKYIDNSDGNSDIDENFIIGDASCINSIEFISATPSAIALKGTGGPSRSEVSRLVFKVVDDYGHPVPDEVVEFTLSTRIGGLSLANYSDRSNMEGLVQTTVNAGDMSTHVRVHARLRDSTDGVTIVSDALTVSTGLPDQDSISLGPTIYNPEAWNYNNETVEIVFMAADHFNNFVPDGTVVYFSTEGGSIDDSCTLTDGVCSVTWRSGNPRPDDGRVTIVAFCIGEESFKNNDNNGLFDPNDLFDPNTDDMSEPYLDANQNDKWDPGEQYWDYDGSKNFSEGNGVYNGSLCSDGADCSTDLVYVWAEIKPLIMSGSWADVSFDKVNGDGTIIDPNIDGIDFSDEGIARVRISIADVNNNSMPYGTKIELSTTNGELVSETNYDVPNAIGPFTIAALLEPSDDEKTIGVLQVKVTTPKGNKTSASIIVSDGTVTDDSVPDDDPLLGDAASIEFISATPHTIALKGTGGPFRSEIAHLVFKVVDEYGQPVPHELVEFTLSTAIGGLSLSDSTDDSDAEGLVRTTVNAGNMSTHVRVHATVCNSDHLVTVVSDELLVSTGLPDQDSITLFPAILNPEAWDYNNEVVAIEFMAADHFNNFVPDGTVVYFSTEGGSIDDSCTLTDGVCNVMWRSSNPKPADGHVTILAFCIGEESFENYDNNGLFDNPNDVFYSNTSDMAEPYLDIDNYGQRDPWEQYWDYNQNGEFDVTNDMYNGSLCSGYKKENGDCTNDLVYVWAEIKPLVMSGSWADIIFMPDEVDLTAQDYEEVLIFIDDGNDNPMPCGTTIEITTTNGKLGSPARYTVPSTIIPSPWPIEALISKDATTDKIKAGYLTVTITTPHGNQTVSSIRVSD
ncbi:MAG: hypothetical protein ACMUIP_01740 [bacterium]